MPPCDEVRSQLHVVENLAVEDDPGCLVGVAHRLLPALKVDDAQASVSQRKGSLAPESPVVGAPVANGVTIDRTEEASTGSRESRFQIPAMPHIPSIYLTNASGGPPQAPPPR